MKATIPTDARVYVAGHRGLVGSAICRRLHDAGYSNLVTASREDLDLRDQTPGKSTGRFFPKIENPEN